MMLLICLFASHAMANVQYNSTEDCVYQCGTDFKLQAAKPYQLNVYVNSTRDRQEFLVSFYIRIVIVSNYF